ncbi:MAG: hypothetical protein WCX31_02330 [Salinivirgaceae bacterium]
MLSHTIKAFNRIFKKESMKFKPQHWEVTKHNNATLKIFKPTLDCIEEISMGGKSTITLEIEKLDGTTEIHKYLSLIKKRSDGIPFSIHIPKLLQDIGSVVEKETYGLTKKLLLEKNGRQYVVDKNSVFDFKTIYPRQPQFLDGKFSCIHNHLDDIQDSYHRLVLPTEDLDVIHPTEILQFDENHMKFDFSEWDTQETDFGIRFMTKLGMYSLLSIQSIEFHYYFIKDINSIIIDCTEKTSLEKFKKITETIQLCFGFLSGKFYKGEIFYLSSTSPDFTSIDNFFYQSKSESLITNNRIINFQIFKTKYDALNDDLKASWKQYHKSFPTSVFSNLCENIYTSTELKRSVELIVNAGMLIDPIQKGALYSVSIETITEYLYEKDKEKYNPIKDKTVWKELLDKLFQILDNFNEKIDEEGITILKAKFNNLNSPTNRDKLTKPFKLTGIELSEQDLSTLEQRNKYLHGIEPDNINWRFEQDLIALKLHTIVSSLILKHCGYVGHIINSAGWYVLHEGEIKSTMDKLDFEELGNIILKLKSKDFENIDQINRAKLIVDNFDKFNRAALEIENLIRIIQ